MEHRAVGKWLLIGAVLLVVASSVMSVALSLKSKTTLTIGSTPINARIAKSQGERIQGLSGTSQLKPDEGMLFVFDKVGRWAIWMKDMNYSIDIIWLDEQKRVVDIAANVSPDTYPQSFEPEQPAKYVLEVPAGFAEKHAIKFDEQAQFSL